MFVLKKKYILIIENIKDIKLSNIKKKNKFIIIYRSQRPKDNLSELLNFRKICKSKKIKLFIANDLNLSMKIKSDGIYISAGNYELRYAHYKRPNFEIIGSAHNIKEINIKKKQRCSEIIYSRLFRTSYKYKDGYLGTIKFNLLNHNNQNKLLPLGGIRFVNLNNLKIINSYGVVIFSELKKKPAIIGRLF